MGREREAKFGVDHEFTLPDLAGVAPTVRVVAGDEQVLDAVYWDTPELRLARRGITLRRRTGESATARWTVKFPSGLVEPGLLSRTEIDRDDDAAEPPVMVASLVAAHTRTQPLVPVARLRTRRRRLDLAGPDDRRLVEVADDEVTIEPQPGRPETPAGWFREVEVEVVGDAPSELLAAVVDRLVAAGASGADPTPKLVRALGHAAAEPAELVAVPLDRDASLATLVAGRLTEATAQVIDHLHVIRLDGDPGGVRHVRAGVRALRSVLRTYAPVLDRAWARDLRRRSAELAGALGPLRDLDVLSARLEALIPTIATTAELEGVEALFDRLRTERAQVHAQVLAHLDQDTTATLLDDLVAGAEAPRLAKSARRRARHEVPALLAPEWRRLRRRVERRDPSGEGPAASTAELHALRLAARRTRSAVATAGGIVDEAEPLADALGALVRALGEHRDAVRAAAWLRTNGPSVAAPGAFVAGQWTVIEQRRADDWSAAWASRWARVDRKRLRGWLT